MEFTVLLDLCFLTGSIPGSNNGGDNDDASGMTWLRLVYYIGGPLLLLLIVSIFIAVFNFIWKMRKKSKESDQVP